MKLVCCLMLVSFKNLAGYKTPFYESIKWSCPNRKAFNTIEMFNTSKLHNEVLALGTHLFVKVPRPETAK